MRTVLYVHHSSQISGAEQSLLELVRNVGDYCKPVVACPHGALADRLREMNVDVEAVSIARLKRTSSPLTLCGYYLAIRRCAHKLAKIIRRRNIDLVHANSTIAYLHAEPAAARSGLPVVWHVRDASIPALARPFLRKPAACIAISRFIADQIGLETGLVAEVVHNGVDLEKYNAEPQHKPHEPVIAMASQMVPWKGHRDFLSMAASVHDVMPHAKFTIFGSDLFDDHPRYQDELMHLADHLGILRSVSFMGYREDLPQLLSAVDVLVAPSRNEPFGRIVIEAMAAGVPVVAYDEGGPREIVADGATGRLVPPGDTEELAESVLNILHDHSLAAEMGKAARERAAEMFDTHDTARKTVDIYRRLLGDSE